MSSPFDVRAMGPLPRLSGGALLDAKATTIDPCIAPPVGCGIGTFSMSGDKTMFGWTAGGGVE